MYQDMNESQAAILQHQQTRGLAENRAHTQQMNTCTQLTGAEDVKNACASST